MRVLAAFFVRDLRVAWSYRLSFLTQNIALLSTLLSIKFVSNLFDTGASSALAPYGGDYFSFALLGMSISFLSYPAVKSFASAVRSAQVTGTFEAMLTTPTSPGLIVVSGGLYSVFIAVTQLVLMLVLGAVLFRMPLQLDHILLVCLVLVMTFAALAGIGLLSAAFTIAFKQTEPFSGALVAASLLVSGIIYPTSVLPRWLEVLSPFIPLTHSVELARQLMLPEASTVSLGLHFGALALFCLAFPLGLVSLRFAVDYARRAGSLAQY